MTLNDFVLNDYSEVVFSSPSGEDYKYGYYTSCPLSLDGTKLLAHKVFFNYREPTKNDVVEIGYFDMLKSTWVKVAESNAFNWQQCSMLQWLGPDFNNRIIFNDYKNQRYVSRIIDLNSGTEELISFPIYAVDDKGYKAISLNFDRLRWTRGYSYYNVENESMNVPLYEEENIIKIDLRTNTSKILVNIKDVVMRENWKNDEGTYHWFEHIQFNQDFTLFSFYYRYGKGESFNTEIYTLGVNGDQIWKQPIKHDSLYSHLAWKSSDSYVLFTYPRSNIGKLYDISVKGKLVKWLYPLYRVLLKPLLSPRIVKLAEASSRYETFSVGSGFIGSIEPKGYLGMDGHPSFTRCGRYMLSDTYADESLYRHLYIYDLKERRVYHLGKFKSISNNCDWRVDLHPRFSRDESCVIIDSNHNGNVQVMVLKINWELIDDNW